MSTSAGVSRLTPRPRRLRINRTAGTGAGFLALSLVLFSLAGAVWGAARPGYQATVADGGALQIQDPGGQPFLSYLVSVAVTGALGAVVGRLAYARMPGRQGMGAFFWVVLVAYLAGLSFWVAGDVAAGLSHPLPEARGLKTGDSLDLADTVSPGPGAVAAPWLAALTYWLSAVSGESGRQARENGGFRGEAAREEFTAETPDTKPTPG